MEQITKRLMNWASILEEGTRAQAETTSTMPFIHPHLALMPDAPLGKGATVGSVIPTLGAIMPAAVGVDIGCGMDAVRTQFTMEDFEGKDLSPLRRAIESKIPLSAGKYNQFLDWHADQAAEALEYLADDYSVSPLLDELAPNWRLQLGSLGSGNHFIELSQDEQGRVWAFLHSGSRGVGNKIAQHHIKAAQDYCERHWISLPDKDLAYLVEGTDEFEAYIAGLEWAQAFAGWNRWVMMQRVLDAVSDFTGLRTMAWQRVSCHHNYTKREKHFGKAVWLSRKGAIDASEGKLGLIPGSMGDKSYVVRGLGNRLALNSAPHGAGRNHSRAAARRMFTQEDLRERMAGVEYNDSPAFVDEHPLAYKPIDQVMEDASDLVEIVHTLKQFVNVKGA